MYEIPKSVRCKKIEKKYVPKKKNHTQDSIYVIWQFAYVHGVAEISLLSGKNTEYKNCGYNTFSLTLLKHDNRLYKIKTLITKLVSIWAKQAKKNFPGGVALEPPGGLSMSAPAWAD